MPLVINPGGAGIVNQNRGCCLMRWLALICATLMTGCEGTLDGDLTANEDLDISIIECFGWCRVSAGEVSGGADISKDTRRKTTP